MNKIKSYYWYIGVPIVALIFGTVLCFELIASTVRGNPHPQINYVIFVLIAGGCAMMLQQVLRMNRDARYIEAYYDLARNRMDATQLRAQLDSQRSDARAVLEIVNDLLGKTVSPVQHAALEAEGRHVLRLGREGGAHQLVPAALGPGMGIVLRRQNLGRAHFSK